MKTFLLAIDSNLSFNDSNLPLPFIAAIFGFVSKNEKVAFTISMNSLKKADSVEYLTTGSTVVVGSLLPNLIVPFAPDDIKTSLTAPNLIWSPDDRIMSSFLVLNNISSELIIIKFPCKKSSSPSS